MKACWKRQWQPTPALLPGKSHGQRSLVGCSPRGCKESDTTEWVDFHFSLSCVGEGNGNPMHTKTGTWMFIAILFVIATNWKPAWKSTNSWMDKQSVVHLHSGIPLSIKKWINYQYTTNWMDLKVIMLSEISQNKQEHIYLHLYKILEIANEYILTGSRLVVV